METQVQELERTAPRRAPRGRSAIDQARDITVRALLSKGLSHREVAGTLGIARTTVANIAARAKGQGEGYPDPRTVHRDELALKVLDRVMTAGSKLPSTKIRASDAVQAVKTYAGLAWPQLEAPAGAVISFTEIHIHEARISAGPGEDTTPCIELTRETSDAGNLNEINKDSFG
jgi:hypothetical protein